MKAKEYLQQLQWLDTVLNQKIKEAQDLKIQTQSTSGIDYSKERVQSSPSGDAPFVKPICRIIDLEAEINAEINRFVDEKHKIINQIQGLKNSDYVSLLFKRYVEFKKFEVISVEMNFTYQYVIEMHGYALKEFETTYENLCDPYCNL
mgnify:CR=1 FL=1